MHDKLTIITGANGWLGLNLLERLKEEGRAASARALIFTGTSSSPIEKISADIEVRSCDISDTQTLAGAFEDAYTVFHCAGVIHAGPGKLFRSNTLGTKNVLDAAIKQGTRRIIHISSNSVMGFNDPPDSLFTEDMPCRPYKKYGQSKYLAEMAVQEAQATGKIETVILRPCWYYGKYQPERQTTFFKMIKSGKPIMFGDGINLRSLTSVPDLARAMLLAEESDKAIGEKYWIADEKPYTMNKVYETIARVLEVEELKPRHVPNFFSAMCRLADGIFQFFTLYNSKIHVGGEMNKNIACSVEKAVRELNYKPNTSLEEGMRASIEWCRANGIDI